MFMKDLLETLEAQAGIGITHDQKAAKVLLAAPEMLEALKGIMRYSGRFVSEGEKEEYFVAKQKAVDAIKKAEGKE